MCSLNNPQKSIRIDAELCDGVQAYALAHRLALKPRWFSNFINSAVREKLVDEGVLLGNSINDTSDGSRGSDGQGGGVIVPSGGLVPAGINLQNPAFCGDVIDDQKARERIAQSEEPYLAYLIEKHSRAVADNQDNYPRGFDYPQNPAATVLNGEKVGDKAGVPVGCEKPAIVDSIDNCPNGGEEVIGNRRVITYPANIKTGTVSLIVDVSNVPAPNSEKESDSSESQNREVR